MVSKNKTKKSTLHAFAAYSLFSVHLIISACWEEAKWSKKPMLQLHKCLEAAALTWIPLKACESFLCFLFQLLKKSNNESKQTKTPAIIGGSSNVDYLQFKVGKGKIPAIVDGSSNIDYLQSKVGKGKGSEVTEDCPRLKRSMQSVMTHRRDQYDSKVPPKVLRENVQDGMGCVYRCALLSASSYHSVTEGAEVELLGWKSRVCLQMWRSIINTPAASQCMRNRTGIIRQEIENEHKIHKI